MAIFSYRASTIAGQTMEGVVEAADERAAVEKLKKTGVIPIKVVAPGLRPLKGRLGLKRSKHDLLTFTTQLSVLLGAGLPLDRSLNILSALAEGKDAKEMVGAILKSIREGSSFSEALIKHPKAFPRLYVNMVRAGEAGGVLDVVLDKLNEFLESSKELKDHIASAMIYPTILSATGTISIIVLLTFVLPKFSGMFAELGGPMPPSTRALLAFSNGLRSYWWLAAAGLAALTVVIRGYISSAKGGYRWDGIKLRVAGDLVRKLETARFCRTLGTLLRSGVSFLQALNNSKDVITNRVMAASLEAVAKGAKEGKGIAAPLTEAGVFPPLALSMIKVGEETGQLETMLLRVATVYEKSLKEAVKRFVGFIEPAMILAMGLVIGFIIISMLMAVFSITDIPF